MKKTYFLTLISALYATTALSAIPTCEEMPRCEDLGYSATISGSCENVLSCPFDTNYKICLDCEKMISNCAIGDIYYSDGSCSSTDRYEESKTACQTATADICALLKEQCGIDGAHVYVTYHPVELWGWNGSMF